MLLGSLLLLATASAGHADDTKPVRVISITREAAEASAAAIAAAKNPTLGVRPGQSVQTVVNDRAKETRNVREARAEVIETPPIERSRASRRVEVFSPTAFGQFAVRVFEVSSGR
jgi:hypothetical protein